MNENTEIETHVVAAVAVVGAALAVIHPGFKIPEGTAATLSTILTAGAMVLEWAHKFFKSTKAQKVALTKVWLTEAGKALASGVVPADLAAAKATMSSAESEAKQAVAELDTTPEPAPAESISTQVTSPPVSGPPTN